MMSWRSYQNPFQMTQWPSTFEATDAPAEYRNIINLSALDYNLKEYFSGSHSTIIGMEVYNQKYISNDDKNHLCDANDKIFELLREKPPTDPEKFKTWLSKLALAFKQIGRITGNYAFDKERNPTDCFRMIFRPSNDIYNTIKYWLNKI